MTLLILVGAEQGKGTSGLLLGVPFMLVCVANYTRHLVRNLRLHRKVSDTPSVSTGNLIIGDIEVQGRAAAVPGSEAVISPFDGVSCLWWKVEIQKYRSTDKDGEQTWKTKQQYASKGLVGLNDGSGLARLQISRARLEEAFSGNEISEERLPPNLSGEELEALVNAQPRKAKTNSPAFRAVPKLLRPAFNRLGRYHPDRPLTDLHGTWRVVESRIQVKDQLFVLGQSRYDETLRCTVIGATGPRPILRRGSQKGAKRAARFTILSTLFMIAIGLLLIGLFIGVNIHPHSPAGDRFLLSVGITLSSWLFVAVLLGLSRLLGAYNRIIATSEQVKAGARLIDIAQAKRASLIPQLVNVVKASAAHETDVLVVETEDRAAKDVLRMAEKYPVLSSDENFLFLQKQLAVVEDDLAMGRSFHAEAVAIAKTRQQLFPDRYFVPKRLELDPRRGTQRKQKSQKAQSAHYSSDREKAGTQR
jgi:LemA protein